MIKVPIKRSSRSLKELTLQLKSQTQSDKSLEVAFQTSPEGEMEGQQNNESEVEEKIEGITGERTMGKVEEVKNQKTSLQEELYDGLLGCSSLERGDLSKLQGSLWSFSMDRWLGWLRRKIGFSCDERVVGKSCLLQN